MLRDAIDEYKASIVEYLRNREAAANFGKSDKQHRIDAMSDDDLLKRWLWFTTIYGALICYIGLPIVFGLLMYVIPSIFMAILWTALTAAMGIVGIIFCLAIYFTVRRQT